MTSRKLRKVQQPVDADCIPGGISRSQHSPVQRPRQVDLHPPYIERLRIRNYQSIADADLELGGLVVIIGANDSGKTALQRAMMALAFNQTGHEFVRWGQDEVEVSIDVAGTTVQWTKGETARYQIGGREFSKLGAAVPEAIADLLGLHTIEIDATTRLRPQFRMQHDTPFLLDETATKAARVLAKNSRLDILVQALSAQKKTLRDIGKKLDTDTAQHERLEERLGEFPDISGATERLAAPQAALGRIEATLAGIQAAHSWVLAKARQTALQSLMAGLPDVNMLVNRLDALIPAYERLERATQGQQAALDAQAQAEAEAAQAEAALREFAATIKICPVCGRPVTADEIMDHDDD